MRSSSYYLQNCQETTNSVTSVDDQIQSPSASSPAAAPSTTANYDIRDTLPPGWKPTAGTGGSRTTLILALSLVLAFFICFLIIGCLFWRKSKRRKRRQEDIEMKARRRRRSYLADDDTNRELIAEREVRVKQKIWARATARWKANARYTARQRRGKRIASTTRMTSSQNSSVSLDQVEDEQHTPHSIAPSLPLSRRSSLESLYANSSPPDAAIPPPESEIRTHRTTPSIASTTSSLSQLRVSPPAYHVRTIPRIHVTSDDLEDSSLPISSAASLHHTQRSLRSTYSQSNITDTTYDSDLISQPLHAAHVATDDKTLLAHLANLASHPPTDGLDSPHPDSASHQVSVPIWQDEQLEDFREQSCDSESILASNCPSRSASPAPIFPPPPSKGKMAAPAFYDYPYSFEDITLEPEPGPSAPPFEEEASCPPMGSIDFAPSAPPLLPLEVEWYMEYPSTPPHTMATNPDVEGIYYRNESHEEAQVPTTDQRSDSTVSSGSSDDILTSPVQGPVSSDGTPPSYHP